VTPVRSDFEPIARTEEARIGLISEAQPCRASQQQYPFSFFLVILEFRLAHLALRNDSLDAYPGSG